MNNYSFKDVNGDRWIRISKQAAFKALAAGQDVGFCANNLNPGGFWGFMGVYDLAGIVEGFTSYTSSADNSEKACFDRFCNSFKHYNCINAETGRYIAFYGREAV